MALNPCALIFFSIQDIETTKQICFAFFLKKNNRGAVVHRGNGLQPWLFGAVLPGMANKCICMYVCKSLYVCMHVRAYMYVCM